MTLPQEILTERLRLRPPTMGDAEQMYARYGHDRAVSRYMSWKPHRSVDDTREYLNRIVCDNDAGRSCGYLIFSRANRELLGSVGGAIDKHCMTFGYCFARDAWGQGFATEAVRGFVAMVMSRPGVLRLQAHCDLENSASARVLAKAGFSLEGTLRRFMVLPNLGDTPRDVFFYAIVREDD
jgi:RimJ/RimL family protein N-acetyltransferase